VRHTKIIATLGPASNDPITIEALIRAGVDVFRLNFSHGSRESHVTTIERVRAAAGAVGRPVAILQDLSGPKIRTGKLEGGQPLILTPGDHLRIQIGDFPGRAGLVSTTYAPLASALKRGDQLLLDDGKIGLQVESVSDDVIITRVLDGGELGERKGINAPNVPLPAVGVTAKDEDDLRAGVAAGVDLVALSFVQTAGDINRAREITRDAGSPNTPIIAKLERPEAIHNLREIVRAADALMVARGDLGLELPLEKVPQVQKQVLTIAREQGVPVIVATQVLESMRTEYRPTRAEVSDAANAVDAGADAIMLSGETATGAYPIRSVEVLDSIIRSAEAAPPPWSLPVPLAELPDHSPALCDAAVTLASRGAFDALVAVTREGRTAQLLSARRPTAPIFAVTHQASVAQRLCLWWGVVPIVDSLEGDEDTVVARGLESVRKTSALSSPATIVIVSASPDLDQAAANFVRLRRL
jgi:pyruvate kinase